MATSLMILVASPQFDVGANQYNAFCVWIDNDGEQGGFDTLFGITETAPVVNARIIADAKANHNAVWGTTFDVSTSSALFAGMV